MPGYLPSPLISLYDSFCSHTRVHAPFNLEHRWAKVSVRIELKNVITALIGPCAKKDNHPSSST